MWILHLRFTVCRTPLGNWASDCSKNFFASTHIRPKTHSIRSTIAFRLAHHRPGRDCRADNDGLPLEGHSDTLARKGRGAASVRRAYRLKQRSLTGRVREGLDRALVGHIGDVEWPPEAAPRVKERDGRLLSPCRRSRELTLSISGLSARGCGFSNASANRVTAPRYPRCWEPI